MRNRKNIILLIMSFCLLLYGCSAREESAMEAWVKTADLSAEETAKGLYEKALDEDVLQIYTVSGRIYDVAESFQKKYPGLLVEVTYLRSEELTAQVVENAESGEYGCDLLFITNGDGSLTENLIPKGLAYKYVPFDMADKISIDGNEAYLSVLLEAALLNYNDDYYSEPPITNWWELIDLKWKGKVYITDPSRSMISYTLFSMMDEHSEEMCQAYTDYFGEEYIGEEAVTRYFIRKLIENDLQIVNDSDDIANAIAAPGTQSDAVGILNASKMRLREQGYPLLSCYDLEPFAGVINPANIMIAGGAKNINSAKLFIRFIMGEADGTGEGYVPFLSEGAWSARTDVAGVASVRLSDISAIYTDEKYSCEYRQEFLDFWNELLKENMTP
ncbi:ABC transporter substrate-binding protein [Anaerovorax odorimutans]|uniref:ABC transporter substrate-binding protein n=1 Tax=Anaerovorax odorimutans TaxID=109327 RepID=UPI0004181A16|nr:extracellular solute-binding protein [Anaerovorax odorimutans]